MHIYRCPSAKVGRYAASLIHLHSSSLSDWSFSDPLCASSAYSKTRDHSKMFSSLLPLKFRRWLLVPNMPGECGSWAALITHQVQLWQQEVCTQFKFRSTRVSRYKSYRMSLWEQVNSCCHPWLCLCDLQCSRGPPVSLQTPERQSEPTALQHPLLVRGWRCSGQGQEGQDHKSLLCSHLTPALIVLY